MRSSILSCNLLITWSWCKFSNLCGVLWARVIKLLNVRSNTKIGHTSLRLSVPLDELIWYCFYSHYSHSKMSCELMLTYDTPAYMFNVYKNQPSRQTGNRNVTGPKTLPMIWANYIKLVAKYQISAINSCCEKCDEKYLGTDGRADRDKTVYPLRWSGV